MDTTRAVIARAIVDHTPLPSAVAHLTALYSSGPEKRVEQKILGRSKEPVLNYSTDAVGNSIYIYDGTMLYSVNVTTGEMSRREMATHIHSPCGFAKNPPRTQSTEHIGQVLIGAAYEACVVKNLLLDNETVVAHKRYIGEIEDVAANGQYAFVTYQDSDAIVVLDDTNGPFIHRIPFAPRDDEEENTVDCPNANQAFLEIDDDELYLMVVGRETINVYSTITFELKREITFPVSAKGPVDFCVHRGELFLMSFSGTSVHNSTTGCFLRKLDTVGSAWIVAAGGKLCTISAERDTLISIYE